MKSEAIMSYNDLIETIEIAEGILSSCENSLYKIECFFIKEKKNGCPLSGVGTSYVDADTIHGGKPELRYDNLAEIIKEQRHLENMIFLQEGILENLNAAKVEVNERINKLEGLTEKVFYNRVIMNYSQEKTSAIINKSVRQIQNIEKKYKSC